MVALTPFSIMVLVFVGITLLVFGYGLFTAPSARRPTAKTRPRGKKGDPGVCPVCGTLLSAGEQIKSALFPGDDDRICHVFGCPHCHPYLAPGVERTCPVCKAKVPAEGYLIARFFERPNKKRHVHILGCTECRMPKRKN